MKATDETATQNKKRPAKSPDGNNCLCLDGGVLSSLLFCFSLSAPPRRFFLLDVLRLDWPAGRSFLHIAFLDAFCSLLVCCLLLRSFQFQPSAQLPSSRSFFSALSIVRYNPYSGDRLKRHINSPLIVSMTVLCVD